MQVDVELLGSLEGVALGETHPHLRAVAPYGAGIEVGFEVEVVGFVERAVHPQVKRIGIPGCKLEVDGREYACGVDLGHRFLVLLEAEQLAWAQSHVLQHHTWADGRLLAVEEYVQVAAMHRVGRLFAHGAAEHDVDIADIPLAHGLFGQSVDQLQAQLRAVGRVDGIGQVGDVAGLVIVVAVVAHEGAYAAALVFEHAHAEGVAAMDECIGSRRVDEPAGCVGEAHVGNAVEGEERVEVYVVG